MLRFSLFCFSFHWPFSSSVLILTWILMCFDPFNNPSDLQNYRCIHVWLSLMVKKAFYEMGNVKREPQILLHSLTSYPFWTWENQHSAIHPLKWPMISNFFCFFPIFMEHKLLVTLSHEEKSACFFVSLHYKHLISAVGAARVKPEPEIVLNFLPNWGFLQFKIFLGFVFSHLHTF